MNKGRLILLGVALLAGGGAFFMVAGSGDSSTTVVQNIVPEKEETPMVRVLVADATFDRGAALDSTKTAWVSWPEESVPVHVITEDNEAFYNDIDVMRARTTIYEGEPIIAAKVVKQGDKGFLSALLTPGMRAASADIKKDKTVSGFVLPGDRVDIMTTAGNQTKVLFENVRILAINNSLVQERGPTAITAAAVTFELRPDQIKKFIDAREATTLTLVLRSTFEGEVGPDDGPRGEIIVMRYGQG